jgi:hypothetical protein
LTELQHKESEEKTQQFYDVTTSLEQGFSQILVSLYEVKQSRFFSRWSGDFADEVSSNFDRSVYSMYPWTQCLIREYSSVVDTAINIGQKPTLENFATFSALSRVPPGQQRKVFRSVNQAIPNCDIKRANLIIQAVNLALGLGDFLKEYSTTHLEK